MVNCNACHSCKSKRGCTHVGALNSLSRSRSFPFFTGPCPEAPARVNGCTALNTALDAHTCDRCECSICSSRTGFGVFSASGPISLPAEGAVNLNARNVNADFFTASCGSIRIRRSGLYYAAVTADIPCESAVDTILRLELGSQPLVPPELAVTTGNYAGHTVFHARAGELLKLSTLEALTISQTTAQPVFTLTLIKLD